MELLACQPAIPAIRCRGDQLAWMRHLTREIEARCEAYSPDLIVLPELTTLEYGSSAFACLRDLDDDLQGPVYERFSELARRLGSTIAYGTARRGEQGRHISQVLVGPDGALAGVYDKLHCAQFGASAEAAHFTPGESLLVVDIAGWRVGVMICYDLRFPELARRLAAEGVELVLHPVAFTRDFSFASWHAFVTARAMENQQWWLSLNRAGEAWGHSLLCPPLVDEAHPVMDFGPEERWQSLTLSNAALAEAREQLPLSRDRRDDLARLPLWQP